MKKFNFKKQILIQDVQLDASVNFQTNGDINVYPCPWESDKVVTNGNRVKYKGGIEVDADGRTRVKRYNVGKNGPLYETIFETAHAAVKLTRGKDNRGRVKIDFSFPKKYPLRRIHYGPLTIRLSESRTILIVMPSVRIVERSSIIKRKEELL